jgi:hypothetical protein
MQDSEEVNGLAVAAGITEPLLNTRVVSRNGQNFYLYGEYRDADPEFASKVVALSEKLEVATNVDPNEYLRSKRLVLVRL